MSTFGGRHRFRSVAFNNDGKLLSAGCNDYVVLFDISTRKIMCYLDGHDDIINAVKFSTQTTMLASGSRDCVSLVWKIKSLKSITNWFTYIRKSENCQSITSLAFCFNDRFVATASIDGSVKFISTGEVSHSRDMNERCPTQNRIATGQEICSIDVSFDDLIIYVGFSSGRLGILQTEDGFLKESLKRHQLHITGICQCTKGLLLATGSWDKTVKLSHSCTPADTIRILRLESAVFSIAFHPSRTMLACGIGAPDNCVELWDYQRGSRVRLPAFQPAAHSVAFSPNGAILAYTAPGRRIVLWDMCRCSACLALAMASHPRLGVASPLAHLETDILQLIAGHLADL